MLINTPETGGKVQVYTLQNQAQTKGFCYYQVVQKAMASSGAQEPAGSLWGGLGPFNSMIKSFWQQEQ